MFTARYGLSPYIKQIHFVFKRLSVRQFFVLRSESHNLERVLGDIWTELHDAKSQKIVTLLIIGQIQYNMYTIIL